MHDRNMEWRSLSCISRWESNIDQERHQPRGGVCGSPSGQNKRRRHSAEEHSKSGTRRHQTLIFGDGGVDGLRPTKDASGEVSDIFEAGLAEKLDRFGATGAASAVDDNI